LRLVLCAFDEIGLIKKINAFLAKFLNSLQLGAINLRLSSQILETKRLAGKFLKTIGLVRGQFRNFDSRPAIMMAGLGL